MIVKGLVKPAASRISRANPIFALGYFRPIQLGVPVCQGQLCPIPGKGNPERTDQLQAELLGSFQYFFGKTV
jgi:hypothetical protein